MDGTDQSVEGTWVTSAGDPITFFNWRLDNGQPDNAGGGEHYLHYRPGWGGVWNDHAGTYQDHVVCAKTIIGKTLIGWTATQYHHSSIFYLFPVLCSNQFLSYSRTYYRQCCAED